MNIQNRLCCTISTHQHWVHRCRLRLRKAQRETRMWLWFISEQLWTSSKKSSNGKSTGGGCCPGVGDGPRDHQPAVLNSKHLNKLLWYDGWLQFILEGVGVSHCRHWASGRKSAGCKVIITLVREHDQKLFPLPSGSKLLCVAVVNTPGNIRQGASARDFSRG